MARRDALLRLHKQLANRRNSLRKTLAGELADLCNHRRGDLTGDAADVAFDSGSDEIASQLAQLEARELTQIERALARMKQGSYGTCEGCAKKISIARLNALPYSTTCVTCQQEMEREGRWLGHDGGDWEKVYDAESPTGEQHEIDISEIEMDVSGNGR